MKSIAWWPTVIVLAIATLYRFAQPAYSQLAGVSLSAVRHLPFPHGSMAGTDSARVCWASLWNALLFGVVAFMGGMGMGDVKLCAAIGAWVGVRQLVLALVLTGIVGGIMAVCWAVMGGFLGSLFSGSGDLLVRFETERHAASSGAGAREPGHAEVALCPRHSDRDAYCRSLLTEALRT